MKKTLINLLLFALVLTGISVFFPVNSNAKVYINIYAARIKKIRVAVPDFKNISAYGQHKKIEKMPRAL